MRPSLILAVALAAASCAAADEPLRVYGYGAAGASVYVAPLKVTSSADATSEIGAKAFAKKYLRGTLPVEMALKPGSYLVSVVLAQEQNMRDASLRAGELVWDGYDYHALVPQKSGNWRYAQCYLLEKKEGFPAEVLAVFTDQMPDGEVQSYDCGPQATRYAAPEEEAEDALTNAGIRIAFHDDIIRGLKAGMKLLLRAGDDRFVVQTDGPVALRAVAGHGQGAWAGHRLNIVSYK